MCTFVTEDKTKKALVKVAIFLGRFFKSLKRFFDTDRDSLFFK